MVLPWNFPWFPPPYWFAFCPPFEFYHLKMSTPQSQDTWKERGVLACSLTFLRASLWYPHRVGSSTPLLPTLSIEFCPGMNREISVLWFCSNSCVCLVGWLLIYHDFKLFIKKIRQCSLSRKQGLAIKCFKLLGRPYLMKLSSAECFLYTRIVLGAADIAKHTS